MTVHRFEMPDSRRGWEPRGIVWDSAAGTVAGDHSVVVGRFDGDEGLRGRIDEAAAAGRAGAMDGYWPLEDPWHVPGEFALLLRLALGSVCWDPDGVPEELRLAAPPPCQWQSKTAHF